MQQQTKKTDRGNKFLVDVPPELNTEDMNERGERSGPLDKYGNAYHQSSVERAMLAWRVVDQFLTNGDSQGRPPQPSQSGGPIYMCKFEDGLWRHASFRGISAPPWFRVEFVGYPGKTGREAYIRRMIEGQEEHVKNLQSDLDEQKARLDTLRQELEMEMSGRLKLQ